MLVYAGKTNVALQDAKQLIKNLKMPQPITWYHAHL